ncbi:hypothetical protein NliqN6_2724 [Naganishia liquefaciens]|uniref:Histone deacetylase domain-containing protein n=1 Tax=Naganishia liquefaciens TaxID=104408 RepID=A0A8H3YFL3_9TREE|nr:hypothetical protein NliqN6_2724 [Naganishia liquefaciens]
MSALPVPPLAVLLQPACTNHKWIRTPDTPHLMERPERIRAVLVGIAAATANLEIERRANEAARREKVRDAEGQSRTREATPDINVMMGGLSLDTSATTPQPNPSRPSEFIRLPQVIHPAGVLDPANRGKTLRHHPALQYAHSETPEAPFPPLGATSGISAGPSSTYLPALLRWCLEAPEKVKRGKCEIPRAGDGTEEGERLGLNPNDLYLGPGSIDAIEGCVLTVSQAVDIVCQSAKADREVQSRAEAAPKEDVATKAFCVIRPPGHHCGQDAPSGFCYVNNVIVGAMHGYLAHNQDRAVIIDIDLHHGNGTQAILMNLNEASHNEDLLVEGGKPLSPLTPAERTDGGRRRRGWKGFYGSLHDIWSYPCEDGSIDLIKDASVSIAAHGQYVENIHLQHYESEEDFYGRLYPRYIAVLEKAKQFLEETRADAEHTTVYISAGFDACEHEQASMQRHARKVPVSFYERITKDIAAFADSFAKGKVVSVLEGGYSDKALTSAAMSHVAGFFPQENTRSAWWQESALSNIERVSRRKRNGQTAPLAKEFRDSDLLRRSYDLFGILSSWGVDEAHQATPVSSARNDGHGRMMLRDRSKLTPKESYTPPVTKRANPNASRAGRKSTTTVPGSGSTNSRTEFVEPKSDKQPVLPQALQDSIVEQDEHKAPVLDVLLASQLDPLSAVDILDVTTKVPLERKHEEKIILKFRNPASQQHAPGQGTLEKPFVSTPPPQQKTGIHLGLQDMQKLVSLISPVRTPHIHIAGTNGKGSVSAMIDSCAATTGLRTGRYNSPHLITPRDAILINGQPISQQAYDGHRQLVKQLVAENNLQNSEFEIETATAFSIFANAEPPLDLLLIECGMGGLRDATNVLDKSRQICSILTVVDMDHQKFLGDTIEAIATDKLGITTPHGHLVVSKQIYPSVLDIVQRHSKEVGYSYSRADDGLSLELALAGRHQQENAATAVAALSHIRSDPRALRIQPRAQMITASAIQLGLQKTQWPGRCSWIKLAGHAMGTTSDIPLLVDGAHNESAAVSLMNYIDSIRTDEPIVFVIALSHSPPKTPLTVLRPMLTRIRRADKVLPVQFSTPVAGMPWISNVPSIDIQAAVIACGLSRNQIVDSHIATTPTLQEGLQIAMQAQKWGFAVVTGSLYLVADAYRLAAE